jgi:hypothetical protein
LVLEILRGVWVEFLDDVSGAAVWPVLSVDIVGMKIQLYCKRQNWIFIPTVSTERTGYN